MTEPANPCHEVGSVYCASADGTSVRTRCRKCGQPVCKHNECSRLVPYLRHLSRMCRSCLEDEEDLAKMRERRVLERASP